MTKIKSPAPPGMTRTDAISEILKELRRSSLWMGAFAGSFILMYLGVVLIIKYVFIYFEGFVPDANKMLLRAPFYVVSAAAGAFFFYLKEKRYSPKKLEPLKRDLNELVRHLVNTVIFLIALSEIPLLCGFFLFFLGAMYVDFYVLAALTAALLYLSIPTAGFLESKISV